MLTGPIFRFELIAAGRRRRYFVIRAVYGMILLAVLWTMFAELHVYQRSSGQLSLRVAARIAEGVFFAFSWVQLLAALVLTPAMAVGTISTERERRTIEYLFATDLSNAEIVVSKVAARLLLVGQIFLAGLPVLMLFRLMGGIPVRALMASYLLAGSTALLLAALATCVSVWSKRSRDATIRVYLVLAALLVLPPIGWASLGALVRRPTAAADALEWITRLNPVLVLGESLGAGGVDLDMAEVGRVAAWHAVLAAALVALATAAVRRVHLREVVRGGIASGLARRLNLANRWRPTVGNHPILWKEAFAGGAKTRLGLVGTLAALLIGATVIVLTAYAFYESATNAWRSPAEQYASYLSGLSGVLGTALLLTAAARAAGMITGEKERDCWVSLMATPLSGRDVVVGKLLGNLWSLKGGVALLAFAWAAGIVLDPNLLLAAALFFGTLFVCESFVTATGLHFSLASSTTMRATGITLALAAAIGGGYLLCCCPVAMATRGDESMMLGMAPCMPFLLVCPSILYIDAVSSYDAVEWELVAAYLIGVAGYAFAAYGLTANLIRDFDRLAGRNYGRSASVDTLDRLKAAAR